MSQLPENLLFYYPSKEVTRCLSEWKKSKKEGI